MKIIDLTRELIRCYLDRLDNGTQLLYVKKIMAENNIPNRPVEGENLFKKKWSKLSSDVMVEYYRCFSQYIGADIDILSGNISVRFIEPILNPLKYRDYYEDKNIYGKQFPKNWLPKTYLRNMNGIFMDEDYNVIKGFSNKFLSSLVKNVDRCVIKPTVNSCSGQRVRVFQRKDEYLLDQYGEILSLEMLLREYRDNFIIQECVEQSEFMAQFNSTSVNTLRIVVYRSVTDNNLYVTNSILRIGLKDSVIDNAHAGGVFIGIDNNGKLGNVLSNTFGVKQTIFNGINFKELGYVIPNYNNVMLFSKNIAQQIPHHRLIALDIALDSNNNPRLIEYNIGAFSYWLFQFVEQPALKGYTDEIIDYCKNYKDNIVRNNIVL